jgi:hypothetical protein
MVADSPWIGKVWLGFIPAVAAVILLAALPGPPTESIEVDIYFNRDTRSFVTRPVRDLTPMHPMMPAAASCLALGWGCWLIWLYRTHQRFARLTNSSHRVKPGPAVWCHFIPGYNLYWVFHWTRRFTEFCNRAEVARMLPHGHPDGLGYPGQGSARPAAQLGSAVEVEPGWLPGIFLCFAMLSLYGALIPRNWILRQYAVMPPSAFLYPFGSLIIALVVAMFLQHGLSSALAPPASAPPLSPRKSVLGL